MPCRDDWPNINRSNINQEELDLLKDYEAAFCAVMTVLEDDDDLFADVLKKINYYREAGLSKYRFLEIWEIHKEKDEARRCREEEERAKTEKVAAIAEKLAKTFTQEDLKILREIVNNSGGA